MRTKANAPGRTLLVVLAASLLAGISLARAADADASWRKKALELNALTGESAVEGEIEALKKDPDQARKILAAASEMIKDRKKQPFNSNATYVLGRLAQDLKNSTLAEAFYELQVDQVTKLESGQRIAVAYWDLIKTQIDNDKVEEAKKSYQKFLEVEGPEDDELFPQFKARVERMMMLALADHGAIDDALKMVERKLKKGDNQYLYLDVKAQVMRRAGKLDLAAQAYEDMIDRARRDPNLNENRRGVVIDASRYALSGVYVDLNQIDKAAGQLKSLLDKHPDNPTYNNDLGFIWADHDMNLAESEKMIRKAIEADRKQRVKENPGVKEDQVKDNPSYLDSLGWVLYKQKKYKEAKTYLLDAVAQEEGQNIEIYDHLADCQMALGEKSDAIASWKKGLETATNSRRDQKRKAEIEKKIKQAAIE